jgi:hypothetical protein
MREWVTRWYNPQRTPRTTAPWITVVSGLPRSGTSLMMRMLAAGGLELLTDNLRQADADNPNGYYEFERVKGLEKGDNDWLPQAQGKAVKIISALLPYLPAAYSYRVIFMERDLGEILASQQQMLQRRHTEVVDTLADEEAAALFRSHLRETHHWLERQPNIATLYVQYQDLLREAAPQLRRINHFLNAKLAVALMAQTIDPTLYRNRQP